MNELERLEQLAAEQRAELAETETAIKVLRKIFGLTPDAPASEAKGGSVSNEFEKSTAREAAAAILTNAGPDGMHYRDVADQAISRGYRGADNADLRAIRDSFRRVCGKYPQQFDNLGSGLYRLKGRRKG